MILKLANVTGLVSERNFSSRILLLILILSLLFINALLFVSNSFNNNFLNKESFESNSESYSANTSIQTTNFKNI